MNVMSLVRTRVCILSLLVEPYSMFCTPDSCCFETKLNNKACVVLSNKACVVLSNKACIVC